MRSGSLCLLLCWASGTSATAAPRSARVTLHCLTVDTPARAKQKPGTLPPEATAEGIDKIAFVGDRVQADKVEYTPELTVTTTPANDETADSFRDGLLQTFQENYDEVMRLAAPEGGFKVSDLQPPKVTATKIGGIVGHRWQIDTIATFEGHRVPWRALNLTTVYRGRAYVVTAAGAIVNSADLKPIADRFLASVRFDACR